VEFFQGDTVQAAHITCSTYCGKYFRTTVSVEDSVSAVLGSALLTDRSSVAAAGSRSRVSVFDVKSIGSSSSVSSSFFSDASQTVRPFLGDIHTIICGTLMIDYDTVQESVLGSITVTS
jgi:hypothetical protein